MWVRPQPEQVKDLSRASVITGKTLLVVEKPGSITERGEKPWAKDFLSHLVKLDILAIHENLGC